MDFVDDHYLAGKGEVADKKVLGRNHPKQGLVHGPHAKRRQHGPLC